MTFDKIENAKPAVHENTAADSLRQDAFTSKVAPMDQMAGGGGAGGGNGGGGSEQDTFGRGHGGYYPYPNPYQQPQYHRPESSISVSPPGHVVPSVILMNAEKPLETANPQQEVFGNHHHWFPYPQPTFHRPESSISVSPPGVVRPSIELMSLQTKMENANPQEQEFGRHKHGYYPIPQPQFHKPFVSISVSPPGFVRR